MIPPAQEGLITWLRARHQRWRQLASVLVAARHRRRDEVAQVRELLQGLRSLARDVSLARTIAPHHPLTRQIEDLLVQGHEFISHPPQRLTAQLAKLLRQDVPQMIASLRVQLWVVMSLFMLCVVAGWILVATFPEMAGLFASEAMINHVQHGELWTTGIFNVTPSSWASFTIMSNNVTVTLFAFALGALYGVGTFYLICLNGLMLGGVFALSVQYGLGMALLSFIVPHGVVELSVIFVAGAAGMRLGEALTHPGVNGRIASFRQAVADGAILLPVCAVFLVGAAVIEGYISPDPNVHWPQRLVIGVGYGALLWGVLLGRLWRRRTKQVAARAR